MKRIATLGAIITVFAVAPSVAAAASSPSLARPQVTAHVVNAQVSQVQRHSVQRHSVQRHRVLVSRAQGFSVLLRMQLR